MNKSVATQYQVGNDGLMGLEANLGPCSVMQIFLLFNLKTCQKRFGNNGLNC